MLHVLLITVFCIWNHLVCPFVFCSSFVVFSVSLHVSMSATLPVGLWFMNLFSGLSLLPPEGSIDGPICPVCHQENCLVSINIMNILLTTCDRQHLKFRWYIKMLQEILGYFILLVDYLLRSARNKRDISVAVKALCWFLSVYVLSMQHIAKLIRACLLYNPS